MSHDSTNQQLGALLHDYLQARDRGETPDRQALLDAHPELRDELAAYFADESKLQRLAQALATQQLVPADKALTLDSLSGSGAGGALPRIRYFGDYELLEEIARGGMGVVYKARQVTLNRTVALKMILKGELATEADVRRFQQEAEAAANLDHPHIVPIYEVGAHQGQHYFSMKLIEGSRALASPTPQAAVAVLIKVARAVHHAHQRGVLHRDLKPSNILIDTQGEPHVADFGLAKKVEGGDPVTRSGAIVGTPAYMAPEQAQAAKTLTTAVDVYSLGAILYEWLTGWPPFRGEDAVAILLQVVSNEPPSPRALKSHLDRDLETICLKCLEKEPARRYGSAEALADDLERWLRSEPILARRASARERLVKWARRQPAAAALAALSLLFVVGFVTVLLVSLASVDRALTAEQEAKQQAVQAAQREQLRAREAGDARQREADQRHRAEQARDAKARALRQTDSLRLASQSSSVLPRDPGLALLLAIASAERAHERGAEHNNALLAALQQCRERKTLTAPRVTHQNGSVLQPLPYFKAHVSYTNVAISPDGRHWATLSDRLRWQGQRDDPYSRAAEVYAHRAVEVREAATGTLVSRVRLPGMVFRSAHFSPDGKTLATLSDGAVAIHKEVPGEKAVPLLTDLTDWSVRLWDVATGQEKHVLKGHRGRVLSLDFSPDGRWLATGSFDHTVRIWDLSTGKSLHVLTPVKDRILGGLAITLVKFDRHSKRLLTLSNGVHTDFGPELGPFVAKAFQTSDLPAAALTGITSARTYQFGQGYHGPYRGHDEDVTPAELWDPATGQRLATLLSPAKEEAEETTWAGFSPDGADIVTGHFKGTVQRWRAADGSHRERWPGGPASVEAVFFAADGQRLLVLHSKVWSTIHFRENLERHFTPTLVVRDRTGKQLSRWDFPDSLALLRMHPDGDRLLSMPISAPEDESSRCSVEVRRTDTGAVLTELRGHTETIAAAEFCPGSRAAVTVSHDGTLRHWSTEATPPWGQLFATQALPIKGAHFSTDGKQVATYGGSYPPQHQLGGTPAPNERRAVLWDARTGQQHAELKGFGKLADPRYRDFLLGNVLHAEFRPGSTQLVTVGQDWQPRRVPKGAESKVPFAPVRIWDRQTGQELLALTGISGQIASASYSPDGRWLLTRGDYYHTLDIDLAEDKNGLRANGYGQGGLRQAAAVQLWDAATGQPGPVLLDKTHAAYTAVWSSDGKRVLTSSSPTKGILMQNYPRMAFWDAATGKLAVRLDDSRATAQQLQIGADDKHVLGIDRTRFHVWDAATGNYLFPSREHVGDITSARISPDGQWIATGANDRLVRLFKLSAPTPGTESVRHAGHTGSVVQVAFSNDGNWLASASEDGTVRVWCLRLQREWLTLRGHRGAVTWLELSPDSKTVLTGGKDGTVRTWPIDLLPVARSLRPRELTPEEGERFGIGAGSPPP